MRAVVLLSGGMDSTVNIFEASRRGKVLLALTVDYGQRAVQREIQAAQKIAAHLNIQHRVLSLPFFSDFGSSSLVDHKLALPLKSQVSIDDMKVSQASAKSVWVPNRNGILLNIGAGFAEALGADTLIPGFNREEAATFPDNTREFMEQLTKSLSFSTANHIRVECPTVDLNKTEIVALGQKLGVDWNMIWPCYQAFDKWCGDCESCQRARRALNANGLELAGNWLSER